MATPQPEFSRLVRLNELGEGARERQIAADADERTALARRFGLRALDRLEASLHILPEAAGARVEGRLMADVVQACVATGDDVPAHLDLPFTIRFVRDLVADDDASIDEEVELNDADCDELPLEGERIDLGETVAQTLALNLDPYPRVPDAAAALRALGVLTEDEAGPFAALKGMMAGKAARRDTGA